jgi:hypothetical protein
MQVKIEIVYVDDEVPESNDKLTLMDNKKLHDKDFTSLVYEYKRINFIKKKKEAA